LGTNVVHSTGVQRLPAPRGLVPRRSLLDRLSAAGPGEVILVCAPAGSGKTVLVRSWVESARAADPLAWISVEREERDAQRFWLSVIDGVADAVGPDGFVGRVDATPTFDGQAVAEQLLSDLHSLAQPVVLVIDDLHELRSDEALRWLELFLNELPGQLQVVLATRQDPALRLHRLRLTARLTEIRAEELRFSVEETRDLMDASGVTLSDASVSLLQERTEGWAAGLRMAAISLARHPDPERFVAEFCGSERTVAGYLLAEVLERQPPEVRDLLLRTSILGRVSGPLADALTGGTGCEAVLLRLAEAGAFVTSLDVGRTWFRYHNLLADLLALELRRGSPALIRSLHRTAAQWFDEHGLVVEAIRHAQAADDWPHAARLLADNYADLVFGGRKATLRALLAAFPADAAAADAELALAFATARLYDGVLDDSAAHIAVAEQLAATVPDDRSQPFHLRLTSAQLWLACGRGDVDTAREAMRALQTGPPDTRVRSSDLRASALMNLGSAELWSLHLTDARSDLEEALALARRIGRPYLEVGCLSHLAIAAVLSGSPVPDGLRFSEEALAIAKEHGWGTHRMVAPAVAAGAAALAWLGRFEEAEQWLDRVESAEAPAEEFETDPVVHFARGFVRLGKGRFDDALAEFRAAERAQPGLAREHALPAGAREWVLQTQVLMGATAAARAALDGEERDGAGMRVAEAALSIAEERPEQAIGVLETVIAPEPAGDGSSPGLQPRWVTVHGLLLDAVARERLGDSPTADASIERALALAEPDGIVLPFVVAPVRELLERHRGHRTSHAALLSTILDVLAGSSPPAAAPPLPEPLSDAELRVVRYLPTNLKAHEIAAELFVSSNTVRTHLRHIYAKLDAHSRTEAVARARQLGLLAPGRLPR
jgi:LuxR family maltose regulon positive regulatory protein